jgi:iron(III) transport system permease protein
VSTHDLALSTPSIRERWQPDARTVIAGSLIILFGLLVIPPVIILIRDSFGQVQASGAATGLSLANYEIVLTQQALFATLLNTIAFAAGSTILALALGTLRAWLVERTNTPFSGLAYVGAIASIAVPHVLYTVAWLVVLGKSGPFNTWLLPSLFGDGTVFNVYSMLGMILVEGFLWSPLAFLMLSPIFSRMDPALEEAASMSGAGAIETIRRVTAPLALPGLAAVALLAFTRTFEAFEIPGLVGLPGNVMVLTTRIYFSVNTKIPPDYGVASAFSVVLMLLVIGLLFGYSRLTGQAQRFATVTGKGYRAARLDLGRWKILSSLLLLLDFGLVIFLPLAMLGWVSLLPFYQQPNAEALSQLTLRNFERVLTANSYAGWMSNTLRAAAISAVAVTAVTALAGWFAARGLRGGRLLDQLGTLPLVFPGVVLGVAMLSVFLAVPVGVYGTIWMLVIAYCVRFMPYGMRYGYSGAIQVHRELEEASVTSGASVLGTLRRITLPLLRPSLIACALFVFLLASRELAMSVLLSSPRSGVVAVALFDLWNNGQTPQLAAFGLVWSALMTVIATIFYLLGRRYGVKLY